MDNERKMTRDLAAQVDVDQSARRASSRRVDDLRADKIYWNKDVARQPHYGRRYNKKAGELPARCPEQRRVQRLITQFMISFRSASLAADFGWPPPDFSFSTAAFT